MANYYGTGRTNTFAVKDIQALQELLEPHDFTVLDRSTETEPGLVSIFADDPDGTGDWSCWVYPDATDEGEGYELYIPDVVAEHLQDGQVALFMHVGAEKQRYLTGYAVAVHSDGRTVRVSLDDVIDAAAATFGVDARTIAPPIY